MNAFEAGRRGYRHPNLLFWLASVRSLVTPIRRADNVLDFGCGHGMFLPLLYEMQPYKRGVGVDRDAESIDVACRAQAERGTRWPIDYRHTPEPARPEEIGTFDVVFGNEIFWFNHDLAALARHVHALTAPGGRGYFTMGSHPSNPLWERRRRRMSDEGITSTSWTVDDVARAFTEAGFAVGLRRLPIDSFFMYHPQATPEGAGSLYDLVQATTECKMLFYFGKHEPVVRPASLRG